MLAPWCEAEAAPPIVRDFGIAAIEMWRAAYPGIAWDGTLVVAAPRDRADLLRFSRLTDNHETVDGDRIAALEPDLAGRFTAGLFFPAEGHMDPIAAMSHLLAEARRYGAGVEFGVSEDAGRPADVIVDCRGLEARGELPGLRGVRGERAVVKAHDVKLARCIRLLHPRHPLYVVPWSDGRFLIGATVVESEDTGPCTVRSALEILGAAYAVHPGFAEAEIVELGAGVRPAFSDNVPRAIADGRTIHVNGAYRHGFLLGPILADAVARYVSTGASHALLHVT
jgi:glycine oxidase